MKNTDWTKWSSIAEIVSSIAILITLIYLAIQTNQNTSALESATSQGMVEQIVQANMILVNNPEDIVEIFIKANNDPDSLTQAEIFRLYAVWDIWLGAWQNFYIQESLGTVAFDSS